MKTKKLFLIIAVIILLSILSVACSKGQTTTPEQNPITTQEPGAAPTTQAVVATSAPIGVPEDVPIMPEAYDLKIPNQLNLTYKVDQQIKDVVAFYQQELPNDGWDQPANPDSVVGSMAQMARNKANGDRITFSIQYNPVGEFTIVQIFITRIP
jgi:hypothetical protein